MVHILSQKNQATDSFISLQRYHNIFKASKTCHL